MSKYKARKVMVDGIEFDSQLESHYYLHLKDKWEKGEIEHFQLQPRYILQDSFKKNGKTFRKIEYVADFEVYHLDGEVEVVDVKGFETPDFKIKRKMFEKVYEDYTLSLIKYVKKFGGWVTLDEWKKFKREEKKVRK